jgi:hypothetical protein
MRRNYGQLKVRVVSGRLLKDLDAKDGRGKMDPFV